MLPYFICIDLGLQQHRLDGEEYIAVIDEFMEAVFTRWPHVIVQVVVSSMIYVLWKFVYMESICMGKAIFCMSS